MSELVRLGERSARVTLGGATHVGAVRARNEDSFLARHPFAVVADGMGGHDHGERASRAVIEALDDLDRRSLPSVDDVVHAIERANSSLLDTALPGRISGSTVSGAVLVLVNARAHWMVFNVGDSRVYRFDGRRLVQVSVDHSLVQELLDQGLIDEATAREHPDRNVITRAVGSDPALDIDVWLFPADAAQTFLVCSDGLTKEIGDDLIADLLAAHDGDASARAQALVDAALAVGGHDNITAVLFEYVPEDDGAEVTATREPFVEDTRPRGGVLA